MKNYLSLGCNHTIQIATVSRSACHQRPARERLKNCIASQENCRQPNAGQYKFYTLARFSLLLNVDITILNPNTHTLTVYM